MPRLFFICFAYLLTTPSGLQTAREQAASQHGASAPTHGKRHPMKEDGRGSKKNVVIAVNSDWDAIQKFKGSTLTGCPESQPTCKITANEEDAAEADAIVWNPRWNHWKKAIAKRPGQRWVYNFFFEAPFYAGKPVTLHSTQRLDPMIDWTMTYFANSDFHQPMGKVVHVDTNASNSSNASLAELQPLPPPRERKKLLLWMTSRCGGERMVLFRKLQALLPPGRVGIYGDCGSKVPCPGRDESTKCYRDFLNQFKFYAAFENGRCKGYITEKFFRGLRFGLVPLAMGGLGREDYEAVAPGSSFVHVDDFPSVRALADRLLKLDRDDAAYSQMLRWRSQAVRVVGHNAELKPYCDLCAQLHLDQRQQMATRTFGPRLDGWFYNGTCNIEHTHEKYQLGLWDIPAEADDSDTGARRLAMLGVPARTGGDPGMSQSERASWWNSL